MPYVKLPSNIQFSSPRRAGKQKDVFDILIDDKPVHAFEYSTNLVTGNMSEEFAIAQAHIEAKDWLRKNGYLAPGE